jgi:hypothetical protein
MRKKKRKKKDAHGNEKKESETRMAAPHTQIRLILCLSSRISATNTRISTRHSHAQSQSAENEAHHRKPPKFSIKCKSKHSTMAIAALFVASRLLAAALSPISDCDETYNYWEPVSIDLFSACQLHATDC